jgi:hexosaminidase
MTFAAVGILLGMVGGQSLSPLPPLVPQPAEYVRKTGAFEVLPSTVIVSSGVAIEEAQKLAVMLRRSTGYPLPIQPKKPAKDFIEIQALPEMKWLGKEGYRLNVRSDYVSLRSLAGAGLFRGIQTLRQLLPVAVESDQPVMADWKVPAVDVSDTPSSGWRGMHLDVSRHFFGVSEIKKFLDTMALYKFNKFHWHLVDDGGWRLEIKRFPELTRVGAWRIGDGRGFDHSQLFFNQNDGVYEVYGGFYTQDQVREVVAYASARHIEVIPEIEMPGHSLPALWVKRELACDESSVNQALPQIRTQFVNTYCPGKEETYQFLEAVLEEVVSLFPSSMIHIGGDEVDRRTWRTCGDCARMMQRQNLGDVDDLYGYFMRRISGYLKSKGRSAIAWDEALDGGPSVGTIMSWRGMDGAKRAAKQGLNAILAPQNLAYFDHSHVATPVAEVYSLSTVLAGLTAAEQSRILGGQGQVWTEQLESWEEVERMVFPRMLALSEALWTPVKQRSWSRFEQGLNAQIGRLDALDVQSHIPEPEYDPLFVAFRDATSLRPPPSRPGMTARFTVDGTDVNSQSEELRLPFGVDRTMTVKVAYVRANGSAGGSRSVRYFRLPSGLPAREPGLVAEWFAGRFRSVNELREVAETSRVETWANQWRFLNNPFGVKFSGFLEIPADGDYTFSIRSDDGSRLSIGGLEVLDLNQPAGFGAAEIRMRLVKGIYPFELLYFNQGGDRELRWEVETGSMSRRSVPNEWLSRARL